MRQKPTAGSAPQPKPTTIDEYLQALDPEKRAALSRLRKQIHAAARGLEEGMSYGLPTFRHAGRPLIYMGAAAKHCAIYGAVGAMEGLLKGYDVAKGTIRFQPEKPLPPALVKAIVRARLSRRP
jgi:uncharacterized protein YdhG (YjbR/CyaY superfamily)